MPNSKAIFLDRDGTINIDKGYVHKKEDFEYIPGVVESLREFLEMGYLLFIITNQSGIARGLYSEEDYLGLQAWMSEDLYKKGVKITKCYYCPHLLEGVVKKYSVNCSCRKPKTGLFWLAQKEYELDFSKCIAIGDSERDLSICTETDTKGILLGNRDSEQYDCFETWNEIMKYVRGIV